MPKLLALCINFGLALLAVSLSNRVAALLVGLVPRFGGSALVPDRPRHETLKRLFSSAIRVLALIIAASVSLSWFLEAEQVLWILGLFSASFGLGAMPLVRDLLAGLGFIFEDTFDVGDKVEIMGIEGVVEELNLRSTTIRAPSSETYSIPNGEIRVVRNFSRGRVSNAYLCLRLGSADLERALPLLRELAAEADERFPDLVGPWQVISESEDLGETVSLTLLARAEFGCAAELRPQLMLFVVQRLAAEGIALC
jgi:small conductance mechanosensitive channel